MTKTHLLVIDPQNDFCDEKGALFVKGASQDMEHVANMVGGNITSFDKIHVTLDSHHYVHIAHPVFWADDEGILAPPFTLISHSDVVAGKWRARDAHLQEYALDYVGCLQANGKYPLVIWPPHCLIGTWGHNIFPQVISTLNAWEAVNGKNVNYVNKGSHMLTEHYSAIQADVPIAGEKITEVNYDLLAAMADAERILVAGEASSHCVANTVRDIIKHMPYLANRIVLLQDTMSAVPGFEQSATQFFDEMNLAGVAVSTTLTTRL